MAIIKNPLTIVQASGGGNKLPDVLNKTITNLTAQDLEGVTQIPGYAFQRCIDLTSVEFPSILQTIGEYAFYYCSRLTTMTILATTPPTLTSTNAISTATTKIYIPAGTLSVYQSATNWSNFADKFEELPA